MERFKRNILIEGIGEEGQQKLKNSKILVVGAGGLGSPVLYYLAAAGVGTLGIIDYDVVDITNLQRQIIHTTADLGRMKVISAEEKLKAVYPDIKINAYQVELTEENAGDLISKYDFIVDCSDNYETKFLINDVCVRLQKPYSHGAILALRGEVMTYLPGNACYRCIFGNPPENGSVPLASEAGVLGSVAGVIGSIQATEVLKYITGVGELLINRLLIFDGKTMNFVSLKAEKNKNCICEKTY
jgi:molybdopterin/thiamine biosynthesis adenylyltransferase